MPSVYIETTKISYLTAKPSRDLIVAAHQQTTSEWWAKVRQGVECFVSPFVIDEAGRGDDDYARKRLEAIADFPVLQVNKEIEALAQQYFAALDIPEKAKIDAFHLAVAAWHRMDYVLSWNCKHIASGRVQKMLQDTNARLGVYTPIVCTPEELNGGVTMWDDPIVNEVRQARLEIEKECAGDFDQIYERALEVQKKSTAKLVSRPDPAKITMAEIDEEIAAYRREKRL